MERLSDEQIRLVNEIWDTSELLNKNLKTEDIKKLTTGEDGMVLPDHKLRAVLLSLKNKHRKGSPQVALVE